MTDENQNEPRFPHKRGWGVAVKGEADRTRPLGDTQPITPDGHSRGAFGGLLRKADQFEAKRQARARREPGRVRKFIYAWFDRLTGAVADGGLSQADAEFEAHRTSRDYIWNTIGFMAWGTIFPILTIVVTQLAGVEQAGMFSLAFVMAFLLYFMGIYGVRTYQVSDLNGTHSFADYQVQRLASVVLMLVVGHLYCQFRGYSGVMLTMCMGLTFYRAVDAMAEVYEGRLQQVDKLYLAGISLTIRSVVALVAFSLTLLITRDVGIASIAMAIGAAVTFALVTFPLALLETPPSSPFSLKSISSIFKSCFPLFVALFMFNLVDNVPKFVMEGVLSYDNQLYFNAMYFPSQAVLLAAGFVYKPLLVRMAKTWADPAKRKKFDLFIMAMSAVIVAITVGTIVIVAWIGIPLMNFLYGLEFDDYRSIFYVMIVAGGFTAVIEFFYQVITILRRQKVVTELYLITFVFSVVVLVVMTNISGLDGAVLGYAVSMAILAILLLREYISARVSFKRHPETDNTTSFEPLSAEDSGVQPVSGMDARHGVYDRAAQVTQALAPVGDRSSGSRTRPEEVRYGASVPDRSGRHVRNRDQGSAQHQTRAQAEARRRNVSHSRQGGQHGRRDR